jgi:protein-tyrosine-phosphatase
MGKAFFLSAALALVAGKCGANGDDKALNPAIAAYVRDRVAEIDQIPAERQKQLETIAAYVRGRIAAGQPARLTFICTHNSRRSHLCQIWAQTAAAYYGVPVETFSGGTAATAFNPRAVATLKRVGFDISDPGADSNPRYQVRFRSDGAAMECFSKVYHDAPNPQNGFCAVMTCTEADKCCPAVAGAALRIVIPYDDPKVADNTANEAAQYDQRCAQIAREMLLVFSRVEP